MNTLMKYAHLGFEWWTTASPIDFGKVALAVVLFVWMVSRMSSK